MSFEQFVFYIFATILVFSAGMVITVRNPVHAAMFLVLSFFTSAALWMLLEAEFLAITLVLVYVGAVMVLFLFVVMMLDLNIAPLREGFIRYLPVGILVGLTIIGVMGMVVGSSFFADAEAPAAQAAGYSNTRALGMILYTDYVYAFEIASVILLVAIIAAITLTLRRRPGVRYTAPEQQIAVKRDDRLRVVKMDAEERK